MNYQVQELVEIKPLLKLHPLHVLLKLKLSLIEHFQQHAELTLASVRKRITIALLKDIEEFVLTLMDLLKSKKTSNLKRRVPAMKQLKVLHSEPAHVLRIMTTL